MSTQVCKTCGVDKPLSEFHFRKDNGKYRTSCALCRNTAEAARRYKATVGDIDKLRKKQNNCCAICGTHAKDVPHASFKHNSLVIDHCHTTGRIRGLLCPTCNAMLGHAKDDPRILRNAISYLKEI